MSRIEEIDARLSAATPGPWRWVDDDDNPDNDLVSISTTDPIEQWELDNGDEPRRTRVIITDSGVYPPHGADREFIAAAPDDIRYLLDLVRTLELE